MGQGRVANRFELIRNFKRDLLLDRVCSDILDAASKDKSFRAISEELATNGDHKEVDQLKSLLSIVRFAFPSSSALEPR
jgi:hypothetical protein